MKSFFKKTSKSSFIKDCPINTRRLSAIFTGTLLLLQVACSSTTKKDPSRLELDQLVGKKVALVELEGETTAKRVVEVALVNQLIKNGSFILVSRQDLDQARTDPALSPTDWKAIAAHAGAEVALRAKVIKFEGKTNEGYSRETVEDSQMAAERGDDHSKVSRLYKVKAIDAVVEVELKFTRLDTGIETSGIALANRHVEEESRVKAARLPPVLRLLEDVSNEAFQKFFETHSH